MRACVRISNIVIFEPVLKLISLYLFTYVMCVMLVHRSDPLGMRFRNFYYYYRRDRHKNLKSNVAKCCADCIVKLEAYLRH